jgi:hypothetical protein
MKDAKKIFFASFSVHTLHEEIIFPFNNSFIPNFLCASAGTDTADHPDRDKNDHPSSTNSHEYFTLANIYTCCL